MDATELLGTDGPTGVGETRPCVLCEYSHAMGNSNGNLHKYWEVRLRFVCAWNTQTLAAVVVNSGKTFGRPHPPAPGRLE